MKIRFEIITAIYVGLAAAISLNCNPSKWSVRQDSVTETISSDNIPLFGTHWKLVELMGHRTMDSSLTNEIYIEFKNVNNRAEGNGGCNAFSSTFTLKNNQIKFGPLVSTKIYCPGINTENEFFKALSATDHFFIKSDSLILMHGELINVAVFKAQ